jgi:hypothetical protein
MEFGVRSLGSRPALAPRRPPPLPLALGAPLARQRVAPIIDTSRACNNITRPHLRRDAHIADQHNMQTAAAAATMAAVAATPQAVAELLAATAAMSFAISTCPDCHARRAAWLTSDSPDLERPMCTPHEHLPLRRLLCQTKVGVIEEMKSMRKMVITFQCTVLRKASDQISSFSLEEVMPEDEVDSIVTRLVLFPGTEVIEQQQTANRVINRTPRYTLLELHLIRILTFLSLTNAELVGSKREIEAFVQVSLHTRAACERATRMTRALLLLTPPDDCAALCCSCRVCRRSRRWSASSRTPVRRRRRRQRRSSRLANHLLSPPPLASRHICICICIRVDLHLDPRTTFYRLIPLPLVRCRRPFFFYRIHLAYVLFDRTRTPAGPSRSRLAHARAGGHRVKEVGAEG